MIWVAENRSMPQPSIPTDRPSPAGEVGRTLRIVLGQHRVEVTSDCPAILDGLIHLFPPSAFPTSTETDHRAAPVARFVVRDAPDDQGNRRYSLTNEREAAAEFHSVAGVLAHLEHQISEGAIASHAESLVIHAAVAATASGAVILPGESGRGKSTLVAALTLAGFEYFSDELAVVDVATARVAALPKPIRLRDGGWQALTTATAVPPPRLEATLGDGQTLRYLAFPRRAPADRPVPVRHVLNPRRAPGAAALTPISRAQAAGELAQHTLNLRRHGRAGVACLVRLVSSAAGFTLTYSDLHEAVALIAATIGGPRHSRQQGRMPALVT